MCGRCVGGVMSVWSGGCCTCLVIIVIYTCILYKAMQGCTCLHLPAVHAVQVWSFSRLHAVHIGSFSHLQAPGGTLVYMSCPFFTSMSGHSHTCRRYTAVHIWSFPHLQAVHGSAVHIWSFPHLQAVHGCAYLVIPTHAGCTRLSS